MISYKVILTKKADKDQAAIYKYILKKFGDIYANKFREKLINLFELLSKQPLIERPAKNDNTLRIYIFSRQNRLVYKVSEYENYNSSAFTY